MIHLYLGDGKGKTSAAIGLAIRAAGARLKVAIVFFDKGEPGGDPSQELYSERTSLRSIPNIEIVSCGLSRFRVGCPFREGITEEDVREGRRGYELSADLLRRKTHSVVILDEILCLVHLGILHENEIVSLMKLSRKPPETELILTGRVDSPSLIQHADLVTEMRKIKHYFDCGTHARRGIEY